jgi:NodT family efflux transporter outer membrane factor (OMF) lipoprotein
MRNQFDIEELISIKRAMHDKIAGRNLRWMVVAAALGLAACAPTSEPSAPHPMLAPPLAPQADMEWPAEDWWKLYKDPQLDALMSEALAQSPTLDLAAARLRLAQAVASVAKAGDGPQIALGGAVGQAKASYYNGVPYAGVPKGINTSAALRAGLDWDLDLFGRNRAAIAASLSDVEMAKAEAAQARLVLTTRLASTYAQWLGQMREVDLARETVRVRAATVDLVAKRRAQGLETLASLGQAQSALETARQAGDAAEEAAANTRLTLAALAGATPDRASSLLRPLDPALLQRALPEQVPADLLGRRPDLRAARFRVEAAAARIRVARAGFYPSVNLAALVGPQVLGLDHVFDVGAISGQAGPAFSLPIFRSGALTARWQGASADYDAAVAMYNDTLLHALEDVATTMASQRSLNSQLTHARAAQAAAEQAYRAAFLRYKGGLLTYIAVLSTENTLIAARRAVAQLETRRFMLDVALMRALGGGV